MSIQISHPTIDAFFAKFPKREPVKTVVDCLLFLDSFAVELEDVNNDKMYLRFDTRLSEMLQSMKCMVKDTLQTNNSTLTESFGEKILHTQCVVSKTVEDMRGKNGNDVQKVHEAIYDNNRTIVKTMDDTQRGVLKTIDELRGKQMDETQKVNTNLENTKNFILKNMDDMFGKMQDRLDCKMNEVKNEQCINAKELRDTIDTKNTEIVKTVVGLHKNFESVFKSSENSSTKGSQSEFLVEKLLTEHYKTEGHIQRIGQTEKHSCDILLTRSGRQPIRIENKNHTRTVAQTEVDKFVKDICNRRECGLFLSQSSKVSGKKSIHFECVQNEFPVLFLSNVEHNMDKILMAIDTLDIVHLKMTELKTAKAEHEMKNGLSDVQLYNEIIPKDLVARINEELTSFLNTKQRLRETLANHIVQSKITADALETHIDSLHFRTLGDFLVGTKHRRPETGIQQQPSLKKNKKG